MAYECPWWRKTGGGALSDYKKEKRDLNYLALAYGKMIYASAGGMSSIWQPNVIDQRGQIDIDIDDLEGDDDSSFNDDDTINNLTAGDVDDDPKIIKATKSTKKKTIKSGGLYSEGGTGDGPDYAPKYWPKPHLVSIQTSGMDNMGVNQKGSYSYKTYNGYDGKTPPAIGAGAGMSWGWAYGGKVINGAGFSGKVIGTSTTANMEGGYDVTVEMLGSNASISAAAFSADQGSTTITDTAKADALGNAISDGSGVFAAIAGMDAQAAATGMAMPSADFGNGISGCIIEIPEDFAVEKTDPKAALSSKMKYKAFVKFTSVIDLCNKILKDYASGGVQFAIDDKTATSPIPIPGGLVSGHPLQLLTPGSSVYGVKTFAAGGGSWSGNPKDLYIASEWVKGIIDNIKISDQQAEGGKTKTLSFKAFFDSIFKMFNENLGNLFTLTLANSAVKSDLTIYITNYNSIDSSIGAHDVGIARSATCNQKVDGDSAAMFYTEKAAASQGISTTSKTQDAPPPAPDYELHKTNLGASGAIASNIAALRADNKSLVQACLKSASNYGVAAPFDLSVTVDGSSGFVYGGVITHACAKGLAAPEGYKVGFAITNIQHSVSVGDWTTSLSTYCRLYK